MARTTASQARQHLSRLLDAAERGDEVIVERRGVRFRIVAEAGDAAAKAPSAPLLLADDAVLGGEWHWSSGADGDLAFVDDRRPAPTRSRRGQKG